LLKNFFQDGRLSVLHWMFVFFFINNLDYT
jgi:hypothetical protein